ARASPPTTMMAKRTKLLEREDDLSWEGPPSPGCACPTAAAVAWDVAGASAMAVAGDGWSMAEEVDPGGCALGPAGAPVAVAVGAMVASGAGVPRGRGVPILGGMRVAGGAGELKSAVAVGGSLVGPDVAVAGRAVG